MKYGYSPRTPHRLIHAVAEAGPEDWKGNHRAEWVCGTSSVSAVLIDEPTGSRLCRMCLPVESVTTDAVYFAERDGLIKIGASRRPAVRAAALRADLLAFLPGDARTEAALHLTFAHLRESGEWFRPAPELLAFIDRLPSQVQPFSGTEVAA